MTLTELVIASEAEKKGRSFRAALLSYVTADGLWDKSGGDSIRPAWLMYACSAAEAGPFTANLRLGRKAEILSGSTFRHRNKGPQIELLRSVGYQFAGQRHAEGVVVTAFLPELFRLDAGMVDKTGASFVLLADRAWADAQRIDVPDTKAVAKRTECDLELDEQRDIARLAPLFCAYLDRRTRAPFPPDTQFYQQVLFAALQQGLATLETKGNVYGQHPWGKHSGFGFQVERGETVGLMPAIAFKATHEQIEALLAEQVGVFFGTKRRAA